MNKNKLTELNEDSLKYTPKYPVLTLEKSLEIIKFFKENAGTKGLSLTEICEGLDMKKSSVHRILDTLYAFDYVEKSSGGNRYKLGWELYNIGNAVPLQHSLSHKDCVPIMNELCKIYSESFTIGVQDNNMAIVTYSVEPNISLKASSQIGEKHPLYATAKGKLFLSQYPDNKIYDFYRENKIETFTNNTITTPGKMLNELYDVRENDYAFDREEHCEGLSCISMPIRNFENKMIATISASGPSQRILPKIDSGLKEDLEKAGLAISAKLGYKVNTIKN